MHPTSPNFGSPYHQTYPELMMPRCITEQGEFLVFLFPLLTYRKKKSNVGFIVKKSRWCWCADEGSWWWWQKIQAFPRGERCYTQEQKKKGKIPVDDENKWPFLSCNSFSLSFIYTHIVVSVLHITLYLAPLKSSFFDLRSSKRSEGSRKSFKTKKKLKCGRRHPPKIGPKTTSILCSSTSIWKP